MKEGLRLAEIGEIPFDEREILHYALLPSFAPAPEELPLQECLEAAKGAARCRAVWCRYPLKAEGGETDLGFARTASRDLRRHLEGCISRLSVSVTPMVRPQSRAFITSVCRDRGRSP